jgi:dUTP pyrophosphatase
MKIERSTALVTPITITVQIALELPHGRLPTKAHTTDACWDCYAAIGAPIDVGSTEVAQVPLGFRLALPPGYEAQIRARSGLALKHGLMVANAPGTVDSGYRGEVCALLVTAWEKYLVRPGDRICQLTIKPVPHVEFDWVAELGDSPRGRGGFGSSGV